jgi:hypothetical protein
MTAILAIAVVGGAALLATRASAAPPVGPDGKPLPVDEKSQRARALAAPPPYSGPGSESMPITLTGGASDRAIPLGAFVVYGDGSVGRWIGPIGGTGLAPTLESAQPGTPLYDMYRLLPPRPGERAIDYMRRFEEAGFAAHMKAKEQLGYADAARVIKFVGSMF